MIKKGNHCGKRKYKPYGLICGEKYHAGYIPFIHKCKECIEKDIKDSQTNGKVKA